MTALRSPGLAAGQRSGSPLRRPRVPRRWRKPLMIVGAVIIGCWVIIAILAPLHRAGQSAGAERGAAACRRPQHHLFGTDENGRDVLSRVIYGARVSLPLGVILVALAAMIGGILGAVAGYFGGWVDQAIMRITDLVFAFPTILLAMVVVAVLGPGLFHSAHRDRRRRVAVAGQASCAASCAPPCSPTTSP